MGREEKYGEWFWRVTGNRPHAYQAMLAESATLPAVLNVPTGAGKTQAMLGAWMFRRSQGIGPRRLVYALPMRTLVEQTAEVATAMREKAGRDSQSLPIHVLMGGEPRPAVDWRAYPDVETILIGSIDMLLSRALNRGYGESRYKWPISFGQLNNDCLWVFDETQLMGPALQTSLQLDGLRKKLGTALPCYSLWMSATISPTELSTVDRQEAGDVLELPKSDRKGALAGRLGACKTLSRVDTTNVKQTDLGKWIAELAVENHRGGTRTLVVFNRVPIAQAAYAELKRLTQAPGSPQTALLHSRFRKPDRKQQMDAALAEPESAGTIIVSTQVAEAGLDLSAATLITETAPIPSIVQRLGRCNREGELDDAQVYWLDGGPAQDGATGLKAAAPYLPEEINAAHRFLTGLIGKSLSPAFLDQLDIPVPAGDHTVLRRRDLLDLFDTTPDLSGTDIDIAPFVREDDQRSILVCPREIIEENRDEIAGGPERAVPAVADMPGPDEVIRVPLAAFKERKSGWWRFDHEEGRWIQRSGASVPPGTTIIIDPADGGYSTELGWTAKPSDVAGPLPADASGAAAEPVEFDDLGRTPQTLIKHLKRAQDEAVLLVESLGLDTWREDLTVAAALHDVGKCHPVFQETIHRALDLDPADPDANDFYAKSGGGWTRHRRPGFRHELVSALLILEHADSLPGNADLVAYLAAAHHGRIRVSIRPITEEAKSGSDVRRALGVVEGEETPAVPSPLGDIPATKLSLACMELGGERPWTRGALEMRDCGDLGPFRLAYLEALVAAADWRASA